MKRKDKESEEGAVRAYNDAIALAHEVADQASVDLMIKILKMEEDHLDWNEAQRNQIKQMGLQNYLANQTGTPARIASSAITIGFSNCAFLRGPRLWEDCRRQVGHQNTAGVARRRARLPL